MIPYNLEGSPDFPVHFRETGNFLISPWMDFTHTLSMSNSSNPHLRGSLVTSQGGSILIVPGAQRTTGGFKYLQEYASSFSFCSVQGKQAKIRIPMFSLEGD